MRLLALPFICATFSVVLANSVHAQQPNCESPSTQYELNVCSLRDFDDADAALNAVWSKVRADAKLMDADAPNGTPSIADGILAAQRAWLSYRDAQCSVEHDRFFNGSMASMVRNMCATRMTKARTAELHSFLEGR
ncbi:lysozyme inhibitor LprI family protein [Pseudahrensia aquimaris]|uniref:Lysozyme inhibitor LprI family protein n=1 Tax=Pseudahrensia aquimaris TaxID=744461 RepID=A0ABW3FC62_9HYPH